MKQTRLFCALGAFLTLTSLATTASAQYTATILNPPPGQPMAHIAGVNPGGLFVNSAIGWGTTTSYSAHALLWSNTSSTASAIDLHPPGYSDSYGQGISGSKQVGYGYVSSTGLSHALLWSGSAASTIDLNPAGFTDSYAYMIYGNKQAGTGKLATTSRYHALLWSGSAASAIDLHPAYLSESYAIGVYGSQQVGFGYGPGTGYFYRALLWSGTAASVVNLNPPGFYETIAYKIYGTQQVGFGYGPATGGDTHALLWSGSAASVVDLNPAGFTYSIGNACSARSGTAIRYQVGYGRGPATGGDNHALVWSNTAASAIDLHQFLANLPVTFVESYAYGVAPDGEIVGSGKDAAGNEYALRWK